MALSSSLRSGRRSKLKSEINVVPYIDVMLVLLIIFMVTAPLIAPSMIDLPSIGKAAKQPDEIVQIVITKSEAIELKLTDKTTSVGLTEVANMVKQNLGTGTNTAVVISADKTVKYETVVKVMDTLQRAGIARVGLSVQLVP